MRIAPPLLVFRIVVRLISDCSSRSLSRSGSERPHSIVDRFARIGGLPAAMCRSSIQSARSRLKAPTANLSYLEYEETTAPAGTPVERRQLFSF